MWWLNYYPAPTESLAVNCRRPPQTLAPGRPFTLLSWNIQYAGSRKYHFFYDGGRAVHVKRHDVENTLAAMSALIEKHRPHILLLQEVDRNSARTHRIDEAKRLLSAARAACWTSAPYHRSRYIPAPFLRPLGRMDMHLLNATRFKITTATRRALPALDEFFVRRAFNLKRAILETVVPISGRSRPLVLLNTHLSAFSFGDGTLEKQIKKIRARLQALDATDTPWILAGDLNLLPPGDDPARLGKDARYYSRKNNPITPLMENHRSAVSLARYRKNPSAHYTYLPYSAAKPDRKIDYVFVSQDIVVHEASVLNKKNPLSDHLPLLIRLEVKP